MDKLCPNVEVLCLAAKAMEADNDRAGANPSARIIFQIRIGSVERGGSGERVPRESVDGDTDGVRAR